jgi:hypothetical protein
MEILVFKTDLRSEQQVHRIEPHINKVQGIIRWNVDLQDCDKILRVVSLDASPRTIEQRLQQAGHYCVELED